MVDDGNFKGLRWHYVYADQIDAPVQTTRQYKRGQITTNNLSSYNTNKTLSFYQSLPRVAQIL